MKEHYKHKERNSRSGFEFDDEGKKIAKLFKEVLPFPNMLTPIVVAYFENDKYIVELARPRRVNNFGFISPDARAVTTINRETKKHERELSELLDNEKEAMKYIGRILGEKDDNIQSAS